LNQFFANLSTRVIAIGAIVVGLIFILIYDPPRTICDSQLEVFKKDQDRFLFSTEVRRIKRIPEIERLTDQCRQSAGPGGCFELFSKLGKLAEDLENIPRRCTSEAGRVPEIRKGLLESLALMMMLAWGERPPVSYAQRFGWLDTSDVALFCRLKRQAEAFYGAAGWASYRSEVFKKLPGSEGMPRDQIWTRSLASASCERLIR